jgi:hypothetical protein
MPLPSVQLASPTLDAALLREIETEVAGHVTLERVVKWGLSQSPARWVVDVIKQDEYTQDVVLAYAVHGTEGDVHLVYDST